MSERSEVDWGGSSTGSYPVDASSILAFASIHETRRLIPQPPGMSAYQFTCYLQARQYAESLGLKAEDLISERGFRGRGRSAHKYNDAGGMLCVPTNTETCSPTAPNRTPYNQSGCVKSCDKG